MSNWKTRTGAGIVMIVFCGLIAGCGGGGGDGGNDISQIDENTDGLETLGRGTDVFGEYAVESNVKGQVLDVDALNRSGWLVLNQSVEERSYKEVTGNDVSAYASQLSATVGLSGSYKFFSAEIQASFSSSRCRQEGFSYATIMETNWKHSLKVQNDRWGADYLKDYLTAEAQNALNDATNWPPERVIQSYGTHVMVGIYIGARLDYHLTSKVSSEQDKTRYDVYASAKYKSLFASATIQAGMSTEEMNAYSSQEERIDIKSKGGDAQFANPQDDGDYRRWHETINTNPVFCGILRDALIPIWEFADGPERQAAIQAAYTSYAEGKNSEFAPRHRVVTDVKVISTGSSSSVALPTGYELLTNRAGNETWINSPAFTSGYGSGDHVWIAYKDAWNDEAGVEPIDELHVVAGGPNEAWLNGQIFSGSSHDERYGDTCLREAVDLNSGTCGVSDGQASDWLCRDEYAICVADNDTELYLHATKGGEDQIRCIVVGDSVATDSTRDLSERIAHIWWGPKDVDEDGDVDDDDARTVLESVNWVWEESAARPLNLNYSAVRYWLINEGLGCYSARWNYPVPAQYIGYCLSP